MTPPLSRNCDRFCRKPGTLKGRGQVPPHLFGLRGRVLKIHSACFNVIAITLLCAIIFGCGKKASEEVLVTPAPGPLSVKHARLFSITYLANQVKLVKDYEGKQLLLVPKGQDVPKGYEKYPVIGTPVERAFFMTASQVGILESLEMPELLDSVVGVTVDGPEWTIPAIRDGIVEGRVTYIPQNSGGTLNIETILALRPDIIFAGTVNLGIGDIFAQFTSADLP